MPSQILFYMVFNMNLPGVVTQLGASLPFSRRAETEADLIGLSLMARACYDPGASMAMLSKLNELEQAHEQRGRQVRQGSMQGV